MVHNINVVNHQVQHHADIDAPKCHRADAMHFHEPGFKTMPVQGPHDGIKAFRMPDLQHAPAVTGQIDDGPRFQQTGRQRFFNQQVRPSPEKFLGQGAMLYGRRGDAGGLGRDARGEQIRRGAEGRAMKLFARRGGPRRVRVADAYQSAAGLLRINAGVVAAHAAGAGHRHVQNGCFLHHTER